MDLWHDIPSGDKVPDEVDVVVEIPRGSQNKYEYDKKAGIIRLDRVLFSPMHYPGDYGLIPQTLGDDNDPLDALVLVNFPTYPGVLINARPIGVLHMIDDGEGDDKILCVPVDDVRMKDMKSISDVHSAVKDEISHFFKVYKELEGKKVTIKGWDDVVKAKKVIKDSIKSYERKYKE